MNETTKVPLEDTLDNVKFPLLSVIQPLLVPFTRTDAPVTGPKSSFTVPEMFNPCALACVANRTQSNIILNVLKKISSFFIHISFIN